MEDPPTAPYTPPGPGAPPASQGGSAPSGSTPPYSSTPPYGSTPPAGPPPQPPPAWRPPPADHGRNFSLVFGLIILLIGLWFFASRTLGLDLPDIEWRRLWPLILIGIGAWVVLGSMRRNR